MNEEQRQCVETIQSSAVSLLRVINDALDFSKLEAEVFEIGAAPFSLEDLFDRVALFLSAWAEEKRVDLVVTVEEGMPAEVIGDGSRVRQILHNLASNAIKFTDSGWVEILVSAGNSDDHGGMGGTGLGLAISRRLAERMNGKMGMESKPGEGRRCGAICRFG